jgi:hypothetical protein
LICLAPAALVSGLKGPLDLSPSLPGLSAWPLLPVPLPLVLAVLGLLAYAAWHRHALLGLLRAATSPAVVAP